MRYLVNLVYDPEYRGYVADVPQLPGCMSQGKTIEKALENVKEAIRAYLKVRGEDVRDVPSPLITAQVEL
jgi:predicted RNase H-like HicB family nuclease